MKAIHLIDHYSYAGDMASILFCILLLILIKFVLYFSNDKKFIFLKIAVHLIFIAALTNMLFGLVCWYLPSQEVLIIVFRDIHHVCLMCCMVLFILYLRFMLGVNTAIVSKIKRITQCMFYGCMILDLLAPVTKIGLHKEDGIWYDSIFNFYNVFYIYGMLMLLAMLVGYNHRLIRPVRLCLVATDVLAIAVMIKGGIDNSSTFTSLTYVMPVFMMMILLHSKPFDDETGAMSSQSMESYVERFVRKGITMDYLVLRMKLNLEDKIPHELGKVLSTFWHKYFTEASFFMIRHDVYILAIPRLKKNGDTTVKVESLFREVFPEYYSQYRLQYKVIGLLNIDFEHNGTDIKNIVNYLFMNMEDNDVLIVDDKLKDQLRIMRSIKEVLVDIERKGSLDDDRVLVYCQPIKNIKKDCYDTAEALMRLRIPEQEIVPPDLFIPLAESYGYIHTLTKIMMHKVCKQVIQLEQEGYVFNRISVNCAVSELRDVHFCEDMLSIIEATGLNPERIGIELTESQNENDFRMIRDRIANLKKAGMTIYLDDFGTGYSNLDRILRLGLDIIKYDRSILLAAENDENASFMLQHFAEAFKQFGYQLLFEGIETNNQETLCSGWQADYLQGFRFSKPIPIEQLREFFDKATKE